MKQTLILFLVLSSLNGLTAQTTELGLFGGISTYSGDLSAREFGLYFDEIRPAYGVFGRLNFNRWAGLQLSLNWGSLQAADAQANRGLHFRTKVTEFNIAAVVKLFQVGNSSGPVFYPELYAGAGFFRFEPEGQLDGEWFSLQPLGTEGQGLAGYPRHYNLTQFNLPLGVRIRMSVNSRLTLALEVGGRKLFTDYLDDVSSTAVNFEDVLLGNGPVAAHFSNPMLSPNDSFNFTERRGGPFNDWYWMSGISLSFLINNEPGRNSGRQEPGCYKF